MSTVRHASFVPRTAAIALALLTTIVFAAPALAKPGGNSFASAACADGGYLDWTDADGNAFRNEGDCVSFAAHGGTLVPVVVPPVTPFSVSYGPMGTNGFTATLTGTGLEPNTGVDVMLTWGGLPLTLGTVADASGNVTFGVSSVCTSLGRPLTAVSAAGTPVGGEHTEYSLPLPDPTICPLPA
jgi:hypothetical protein